MFKLTLLFTIFLFGFSSLFGQLSERNISSEKWFFKSKNSDSIFTASVPGYVHLDLLRNNIIPDPFYANNEKIVKWIDTTTFIYYTDFVITKSELAFDSIELVLEGIDTYSEVFINGNKIAETANMFISYQIPLKKYLLVGKNTLIIVLKPASVENSKRAVNQNPILPESHRIYSRKAQYMFGWDWGPALVSAGIWKEVKLVFWNRARLTNVEANTIHIDSTKAVLEILADVNSKKFKHLKARIEIETPIQRCKSVIITDISDGHLNYNYVIKNPVLWWTHDLGKPNLYSIKISLLEKDKVIDIKEFKIGLRTIRLVQNPDSAGTGFYFELNGIPVFARGVNSIPFSHFTSEVKLEDYDFYLSKMIEANMNMVRVWGGGVYESDIFYSLCDEKGILVWQDFMFAGAMYPLDPIFQKSVEQEIVHQVKRLKHHASIALWCGNNEISEAWHNWGWQKQFGYSSSDSLKIITEYQSLFEQKIPEIVHRFDPQRSYHPSSPTTGWGRNESLLMGDVHYWGVWWGMEPIENYRVKVGRFISEYGFQSLPAFNSIKRFIPESELSINSPSMKNHQKHPTGFETINTYLERDYPKVNNLDDEIYLSQLLQADAMKMAIESHRKAKPYCMGSLIWQLNDTWPVVSWSLIDCYKNPKMAYYQVKRSFRSIIPIISNRDSVFVVHLVNDATQSAEVQVVSTFYGYDGIIRYQRNDSLILPEGEYSVPSEIWLSTIPLFLSTEPEYFLNVEVFMSDSLVSAENFYKQKAKDMKLSKAEISFEITENQTLIIKSESGLVKGLWLESEGVTFSDNGFDLLPGKPKEISFHSVIGKPLENNDIRYKSLNDFSNSEREN